MLIVYEVIIVIIICRKWCHCNNSKAKIYVSIQLQSGGTLTHLTLNFAGGGTFFGFPILHIQLGGGCGRGFGFDNQTVCCQLSLAWFGPVFIDVLIGL